MLVENDGDQLSVKEVRDWKSSAAVKSYTEHFASKKMIITKQSFQTCENTTVTAINIYVTVKLNIAVNVHIHR